MSKINILTPKGELKWAFITGEGKKDLQGRNIYTVDLVLPLDEAEPLIEQITTLWEEEKPKGAKAPKSLGFKVKEEEQTVTFTFKTSTTYKSGDPKEVEVFDSKNVKTKLTSRIGNGSIGRVAGSASIYDAGVAARGVTLYLDKVQILRLVKFVGGPTFDVDEEGEFESESTFTAEEL